MAVAWPGQSPARVGRRSVLVSSWWNRMFCRNLCHRVRFMAGIGAAAASLLMAGGWAGSERSGQSPAADAFWRHGVSRAIAVRDGRTTFRVTAPPHSQTLVVVSALAPSPGPFAIRLSARSTTAATVPKLADDGPRNTPKLTAPALPQAPEPVNHLPPHHRIFHMMVREGDSASPSNYAPVRGVLKGVGRRGQVYVRLG